MKKIGFVILFLAFPISYSLTHFMNLAKAGSFVNVFMICTGVALLSFIEARLESNKKVKHLFYYSIMIFNISIIAMYLIDFIADPIFETGKVIWSIIITTFISLCIYLYKLRF